MPVSSPETVSSPFTPVTCPSQQLKGFTADPPNPFKAQSCFCNMRVVMSVCLLGFVFACVSQLNLTALRPLRVMYKLCWLKYSDSVGVESPNLCHLVSFPLQCVGNSLN